MKIQKQILISVLIFLVTAAVLVGFYFLMNRGSSSEKPKDMEAFTKCLSDGGVKIYGASWCPHCQNQKKMFGDSIKNIYIECYPDGNTLTDICKQAGINGFPTWEFQNGKRLSGGLTFQQISDNSNCPL